MTSSGQSAWDRNYPMSEADFYEKGLPDDIGPHKWKDLARALGFNQASIDGIHIEKGNAKECCIEVLVRWLRQNGTGATAGKLTKALTQIGLKNLADRFPIKPNDTNRNDKIEETVREFCEQLISFLKEEDSKENSKARDLEDKVFKMSNRIKELEEENFKMSSKIKELDEEVSRLRARNNELQDGEKQEMEDLEDKLSIDMNACNVSEEADEEARERRISAQLQKYTRDLKTYVTSTLEVPEVKQDQLKTAVQLNILKTLSEHLEGLYIATRDMASETCKCSEDLKRDFYDFAYHGLRADHNELVHRFKDLEDGVQEMSEEEKEELQRLKEFQLNRQSLIKELEEKWRALFSPPERLPETRWSESPARGEKSPDIKKVKRNTAPGARPKQKNVRDELIKPEAPLTSEDAPPIANNSKENSKVRELEDRVSKIKELEEKVSKMKNMNKELEEEDSKENSKARDLEDKVFKMSNRIKELEEENFKMSSKIKELDEEVSKMKNMNKELEEEDLEHKLSKETDEEARERRVSEKLQKYIRDLKTYVTSSLEVPEVKQDQLKTPVKLGILKTLSEHLGDLYIGTRDMVSETCKCSEDLRREFYDFGYHGLRADHNELIHRVKELDDTVQEMSEEEKEELQKLKEFQMNRESLIKELEEKWRALFSPVSKIREFEEEDLEDKLSFDMNPCAVSGENDEEVRERRISAELQTFKHKLATYVTSPLEVPEVNQDQFKTPVKLVIVKTLSEHLEDLYIGTREMVSETCKCSVDLKREFYDFAYHGLRADHDELVYRVKDLEDTVEEMGEEEKEELQKVKEFQVNRESLIKELEEKWRALFSPPGRLPKNRWSADITRRGERSTDNKKPDCFPKNRWSAEITGRGERSTDNKKVMRNTDRGARPKQRNVRDKRLQNPKPLSQTRKKKLKCLRLGKFDSQRLKES